MSRAVIATTLRNAEHVLDSFLTWHFAIGFAHAYLFFDDPADPCLGKVQRDPRVTAIIHDDALRSAWPAMPSYAEHGPFVDAEVMSRQILNVELAMQRARSAGFDWLLNIDADELFLPRGNSIDGQFEALSRSGIETVLYRNLEAVPETEAIGDFFREVDLFKVPADLNPRPLSQRAMDILRTTPQLQPNFFHFYGSGKSAVRLDAVGMKPAGVHEFARESDGARRIESRDAFILHYPCCGFDAFWTKYRTLGRFGDDWWGKYRIQGMIGPLHLEARDVVAHGDEALAREFYRTRIELADPVRVNVLLSEGILTRIPQPRAILQRPPAVKLGPGRALKPG